MDEKLKKEIIDFLREELDIMIAPGLGDIYVELQLCGETIAQSWMDLPRNED